MGGVVIIELFLGDVVDAGEVVDSIFTEKAFQICQIGRIELFLIVERANHNPEICLLAVQYPGYFSQQCLLRLIDY